MKSVRFLLTGKTRIYYVSLPSTTDQNLAHKDRSNPEIAHKHVNACKYK